MLIINTSINSAHRILALLALTHYFSQHNRSHVPHYFKKKQKLQKCFNKTTALGFSQWLKKQNIDFLIEEPERKVLKLPGSETEKLRIRVLSVLDSQFHDEVANNIVSTIPRHHAYIKQLKGDGYEVIGCCRKSKKESDNRALLLQRMINILYKRSLVQKVFVSPCSSAKQALSKRDLSDQDILSSLDQIHGNTQDFLTYVKEKKTKICVVTIDYAGFTNNMSDLKNLLKEHSNIQKIMVDLFFYQNHIKVFDRNQLLNCVEYLKQFNCRPDYRQRSK